MGQALLGELSNDYTILATGKENEPALPPLRWDYLPLDITNKSENQKIVSDFVPDVIVNAASFTHVDACEKEKETCWKVNVKAVEYLARFARRYDIHLIHYSTDYIFDGRNGPYAEDDRPNPVGYYGKSKLASENVLRQEGCPFTILRTCVLYGRGVLVKPNFFLWVLNNLKSKQKIKVVTDQYNNPTLVDDLANGTRLVIEHPAHGVFHFGGSEYINRYDFALSVADVFNLAGNLISPVVTDDLDQVAERPLRGGLKIVRARDQFAYHPRSVVDSLIYLKQKMEQYD